MAAKPKPKPARKKTSSRQPARPTARKAAASAKPADGSVGDVALLRELSNAVAVSGDESAVRKRVLDAIRGHVDEVKVDALGNVLAVKKARNGGSRDRVLVAAHMDEVGLMITDIESDGALRFEVVGNIADAVLLGKTLLVGPNRLPGLIGAAPVHLLSDDRRYSVVKANQMRIELGVTSGEAAKKLVKVGDRAAFATEFAEVGPSLRGKALDDRLGCATLIELLRGPAYSFELHAAFTVQEEVGLRGARVAGYAADPACAFVLDCSPAHDLPPADAEKENTQYNTRLGFGPAIYVSDRATISDDRLVRYLRQTAEDTGLPYQYRQPGGGGTDAGAIHLSRGGVPSVSISVPGRYLHTPAALARADDWRNSLRLVRRALENWTPKVLKR
jgi:endoglucanase